jgi:hypothetical protein
VISVRLVRNAEIVFAVSVSCIIPAPRKRSQSNSKWKVRSEMDEEKSQPKLVKNPPTPDVPHIVQHGFASVDFQNVHLERDKNDMGLIEFSISTPLVLEMLESNWLPDRIAKLYRTVEEEDLKEAKLRHGLTFNGELAIVPQGDDRSLKVKGSQIESVKISKVVESGTGEDVDVTRLQCRLSFTIDDAVWAFARVHFGHAIWLKWGEAQSKLKIH